MTNFNRPSVFTQLFRLLTLRDMSIVWWTMIALFWLLGFVSTASSYAAHLILVFYYYLRLLPSIAALLTGSYGRLLFSHTASALIPFLLIALITLLGSLAVVQYTALAYSEAVVTLFCGHLILHAVFFSGNSHATGLIIFPIWAVMIHPQFFLQTALLAPAAQPSPMVIVFTLSLAATVFLLKSVNSRGKTRQPQPAATWRFSWRAIPKYQPSLGACFLFQYNAQPVIRLLVFSIACAVTPLLQSSVYFWLHSDWQWFPELDWKFLNDSVFIVPLLYWLIMVDSVIARTKAAWLYLPFNRQQLWYYYERHFVMQLLIFSLPLLVLLYLWQPHNPYFPLSSVLLLSKLLLITYLVLYFPRSSMVGFAVTFILYLSASYKVFLTPLNTQLYSALFLLTAALVLRHFALKRWQTRNYSPRTASQRRRHV